MKALGASASDIFQVVWTETVLICVFGGLLGTVLAFIGSALVEKVIRHTLPYAPSGKLVLIKPELLFLAFLATIVMGLVAGIYPALRASLMKPVEAIRAGE
jgi:putative ABC transport system permease protein